MIIDIDIAMIRGSSNPLDHISINGISRSRFNSEGNSISPTEEGLQEFWDWYHESQFIDSKGRPLVLYHGSNTYSHKDGEPFNTQGRGKTSDTGAFFSDSIDVAKTYGKVDSFYLHSGKQLAEVSFNGDYWNKGPIECVAYDFGGDPIGYFSDMESAIKCAGDNGSVIDTAMTLDECGNLTIDDDDDTGTPPTTDTFAATARRLQFSSFVAWEVIDVKSGADDAEPSAVFVVFQSKQIRSVSDFSMESEISKLNSIALETPRKRMRP